MLIPTYMTMFVIWPLIDVGTDELLIISTMSIMIYMYMMSINEVCKFRKLFLAVHQFSLTHHFLILASAQ